MTCACTGSGPSLLADLSATGAHADDVDWVSRVCLEGTPSNMPRGSILASLDAFKKLWVSKREYEEDNRIIARKFF